MSSPSQVTFRWSPEFVALIDSHRGLVPRSAFVRACVEAELGRGASASGGASVTWTQPATVNPKPPLLRCPSPGCTRTATSPNAVCDRHGFKVR